MSIEVIGGVSHRVPFLNGWLGGLSESFREELGSVLLGLLLLQVAARRKLNIFLIFSISKGNWEVSVGAQCKENEDLCLENKKFMRVFLNLNSVSNFSGLTTFHKTSASRPIFSVKLVNF